MDYIFDYTKVLISIISALAAILVSYKSFKELRKGKDAKKDYSSNDLDKEIQIVKGTKFYGGDIVMGDIHKFENKYKEEPKEVIQTAFELKQLDNYYSQALSQSKISFWFSILFASIGFVIIIIAGFLYSENNIDSTVISLISGTIIDSVAALFFVQTRRAQQNMSSFFQKLREDKQYIEAKGLCESLESIKAKDALKIQLALNFSKIQNAKEIGSEIIKDCLNKE